MAPDDTHKAGLRIYPTVLTILYFNVLHVRRYLTPISTLNIPWDLLRTLDTNTSFRTDPPTLRMIHGQVIYRHRMAKSHWTFLLTGT
jgi:hypothetical protein